ncbi:ankyrin [Cadophora sp. DSE1049]|nr:ankyrin [Cadophora sp. DSE1049]
MVELSPPFYDLSLDIFKTLLDHVMETIGLCMTEIMAELFSREIPGAVFRSRALELPEHRNTTGSPSYKHIVGGYLLYRALSDGRHKQNLSGRLHRILEILLPDEDYYSQRYQSSVRALVDALVSTGSDCYRCLRLIRCSEEPTLVESTLARDCLRAGAVLGISQLFDDIVVDSSRDDTRILYSNDYSAAFKDTPLICATIGHQHDLVRRILDAHTKTGRDHIRWQIGSSLREASTRGNEGIVRLLLEAYPGDLTELYHIPSYAAAANQVSIFYLLCEHLHAPSNDFRNIREAARYGHIDFVKLCLANGTDVNANASPLDDMWELQSPLHIASSRGYRDIVQLLLSHGSKATDYTDNFSSLTSAASHGHCEIIQDLLAAGSVPVHHEKWSPLTSAVRNGQVRAVEVLLDSGVELWYKDRALSLAAEGGYDTLVRLLVKRGAKIDGEKGLSSRYSPMMEAHAHGHEHIIELLLELGATAVDPYKSHYAKDIERGMWPRKPLFGLKPMHQMKH